jgi:CheY-like chemotaxis protein
MVLLDLTMPEMDGVETFHAIHQAFPNLPVILMSGYTEQEATVRFTTGLTGFLQKPFQSPALLGKVKQVLG